MVKPVTVTLDANRSYPIFIGEGVLSQVGAFIQSHILGKKALIITHPTLAPLYANVLAELLNNEAIQTTVFEIPEGESAKTMETVSKILDNLIQNQFERGDLLIALGGGVVGDIGGFAAAIYLRGIHFIQCPTSLLAQVDAAIGGKTGVNHPKGKNLIGAFYQPKAVFSDLATLKTLPKEEMRCGLAEVVKYGVISNPDLFNYIEEIQAELARLIYSDCPEIWEHLVQVSSQEKAKVVAADEKESGLRETLNFGHTIGHAIEAAKGYDGIKHGDAVAIGMHAAAAIAVKKGLFSKEDHNRLIQLLKSLGFELTITPEIKIKLIPYLKNDKKVRDKKIRFVLPTKIGKTVTRDDVSSVDIQTGLDELT